MKIYMETTLDRFDAWSGGEDTLEVLRDNGMCDTLEAHIECDIFPDGCTDTELNDFLWFERDFIANLLGFSDWEALENDGEEEEEDNEWDDELPDEANEHYDEISEATVVCDTFEEFCKHDEFGLCDCENCAMGCLNCNTDCEEVFNRFKELEG